MKILFKRMSGTTIAKLRWGILIVPVKQKIVIYVFLKIFLTNCTIVALIDL